MDIQDPVEKKRQEMIDAIGQLKQTAPTQTACPQCGYCPHCGRSGQQVYRWYQQPCTGAGVLNDWGQALGGLDGTTISVTSGGGAGSGTVFIPTVSVKP